MFSVTQRKFGALAFGVLFLFHRLSPFWNPHRSTNVFSFNSAPAAADFKETPAMELGPPDSTKIERPLSKVIPSLQPQVPFKRPYAFATLLSSTTVDLTAPDDDDVYFVGARLLCYQLLHAPETRLSKPIPFVVAVTKDVPSSKRNRLIHDGAEIIEVEKLSADWVQSDQRYSDVLTKLRIANWTQFERVMFLDVDTVLSEPLDGIFDDPAARVLNNLELQTRNHTDVVKDDEAPQPSTYVFAGAPSLISGHKYPPTTEDENMGGHWVNGGFWLIRPSQELFALYKSVLDIPDRFGTFYPEECLLNYVHRNDGNMPWFALQYDWGVSGFPSLNDLESGAKSLHDKWWQKGELSDFFEKIRWQMDGFYRGRDSLADPAGWKNMLKQLKVDKVRSSEAKRRKRQQEERERREDEGRRKSEEKEKKNEEMEKNNQQKEESEV